MMYPAIQYGPQTGGGATITPLLVKEVALDTATQMNPRTLLAAPAVGKKWFVHSLNWWFAYERIVGQTGPALTMDWVWLPTAMKVIAVSPAQVTTADDVCMSKGEVSVDYFVDESVQFLPDNFVPPQTTITPSGFGQMIITYAEVDA